MTNERTQDILNKSKRNHNANSKKKDGFIQLEINVDRRGVNEDDNDLKVDVKVRFTEWEEEERKGDEMDLMVVRKEGGVESSVGWRWWVMAKGGVVGGEMVGWVGEV
ncbi:hypothetical protein Tco_0725481 [Tanacetum coccineum]|uniref:Uncharacterized protein n=1 Tax=Tanacetum coccineum TaxID=301880 RepID=A0ABQ4YD11_9ASTR